ncbi:hypothetical protein Hamer_G021250 [Homarus americanus]|uniref:Uncharacterized protein n=1 Tax=Homarus americanus TaxID=6706 RepID=A0A8J5MZX0_HOMAM|nr:hypothetical protein Hamer_G021250 [Homarus americanus]
MRLRRIRQSDVRLHVRRPTGLARYRAPVRCKLETRVPSWVAVRGSRTNVRQKTVVSPVRRPHSVKEA